MNGLNSKLKDYKTEAEKKAFGDGFWYAWQLADEQTKLALAKKEREIELLLRQVNGKSNLAASADKRYKRITLND